MYIAYRLLRWHSTRPDHKGTWQSAATGRTSDLSLRLQQRQPDASWDDARPGLGTHSVGQVHAAEKRQPDPFLFLIHDLLAADMLIAIALLIEVRQLGEGRTLGWEWSHAAASQGVVVFSVVEGVLGCFNAHFLSLPTNLPRFLNVCICS